MQYISEIVSFLAGLVGGSLLTLQFTKKSAGKGGVFVDQSQSKAKGDIVGGNKIDMKK